MLLTFLYHRVHEGKYANSKETIEKHLTYLANHYKIITPGDKISFFKLNICLTFDDAYCDFYYYVYPLLKKLNIKAQLAVPIKFIQDKTDLSKEERLSIPYSIAMKDKNYLKKVPFCTWEELKEMHDSGLVNIASHSYNHKNLLEKNIDYNLEIVESKRFLEERLNSKIETFVYPLGKFNEKIHSLVKNHYKYAMRIGSAWNITWNNVSEITYRIISDELKSEKEHLNLSSYISYLWFFFLNTFRKR